MRHKPPPSPRGTNNTEPHTLSHRPCDVVITSQLRPHPGRCIAQGLLTDGEGAPAANPALAAALMRLAGQVHGSSAEVAALLLDAVAACMQLGDSSIEEGAGESRKAPLLVPAHRLIIQTH